MELAREEKKTMGNPDTISVSRATLLCLAGTLFALLSGAGALVWDASAKLTRIAMRIVAVESQQTNMREDIIFIRAGMIGPLRSGEGR